MMYNQKTKLRHSNGRCKDLVLTLFSVLLFILLIVYTWQVTGNSTAKDVDMQTLSSSLGNVTKGMLLADENAFQKTYHLDSSINTDWLFYNMDSIMDIDELLIVKSTDAAALDKLQDAVRTHLHEQIVSFENYGTTQSFYLKNAILQRVGNYLFFAVGENAEAQQKTFLDCIK